MNGLSSNNNKKRKQKTVKFTGEQGYDGLANAIVIQALVDYEAAITRIYENNFTKLEYNEYKCRYFLKEVPEFFHSSYFEVLSNLNGQLLLDAIIRNICKKYGVTKNELPLQ